MYSLRVLKMGQMNGVAGPQVFWMSDFEKTYPLFFWMAVIQGGGKTVIVNTGPPRPELPAMNDHWRKFGEGNVLHTGDAEHPVAQLESIGIRAEDVDYVICTPFQNYATGNIDAFPRAQICLSRRGWIEFMAPRWRQHPHDVHHFCIPPRIVAHLVTDAWDRVHLLEDEEELLPGLGVFWTGVHHRNSIAVSVETPRGRAIISDCFFKYGNVERMHPLGINESLEECLVAYHRIRREADLLVPLYDPEVVERHPGGIIA